MADSMTDGNCVQCMGSLGPCLMCEWVRRESIGLHERDGGETFNVERATDDGTDHIPVNSALRDVIDGSPLNDVTDVNDATTAKAPTPYRAKLRSFATNKTPIEQYATAGTAPRDVTPPCAPSVTESDRLGVALPSISLPLPSFINTLFQPLSFSILPTPGSSIDSNSSSLIVDVTGTSSPDRDTPSYSNLHLLSSADSPVSSPLTTCHEPSVTTLHVPIAYPSPDLDTLVSSTEHPKNVLGGHDVRDGGHSPVPQTPTPTHNP